jgi:hypothetical protein
MRKRYSYTDRTLDARDLVERYAELKAELDELEETLDEAEEPEDIVAAQLELDTWRDGEDGREFDDLDGLDSEVGGLAGLAENEPILVNDSHFAEYAEELCKDCGYISSEFPSWIEVDWEATADNLKADYASADLGGETFWYRSY